MASAQVDHPEVLLGHANERETHISVPHGLRTPAQIELMRSLQDTLLQVFETTVRRETSANGRSAARNAKSGSKISPTSFCSGRLTHQLIQNWKPFQVFRQTLAVSRRAEQVMLTYADVC